MSNATIQDFRKKPVVIQAMQWDGTAECASQIIDFVLTGESTATYKCVDVDACATGGTSAHVLSISTLEGDMEAGSGWWIIRGVAGEFYPCRPDIFEATYERAA